MLKQMGIRMTGGGMPQDERKSVEAYVKAFEDLLEQQSQNIPPKIIRAKLAGSVFILKDPNKIIVVYAPKVGNEVLTNTSEENVVPSHVIRELSLYRDLEDIAVAILPTAGINLEGDKQKNILLPPVTDLIKRSVSEYEMKTNISAYAPIFGQNKFPLQDSLIFVLMPFEPKLSQVYDSIIKPAIEEDLNMVCRRADEISSNNPIIQDIWKSICECRIILADLTGFNPNVMYELGIAHTIGKPSVIMHQENSTEPKFPFDLAHIRRINYADDAAGGVQLREQITSTIRAVKEFES